MHTSNVINDKFKTKMKSGAWQQKEPPGIYAAIVVAKKAREDVIHSKGEGLEDEHNRNSE